MREAYGSHVYIMAGNVCTLEGINDLADWGANAVRCNIGGGSICSTRLVTGHGLPGLQTIFDCARTDRDVAIIADGGIKTSGDILHTPGIKEISSLISVPFFTNRGYISFFKVMSILRILTVI